MALNLSACGGGSPEPQAGAQAASAQARIASVRSEAPGAAAVPQAQLAASADARLLASNCSQCHGTQGMSGFGEIRGSDASELAEFATKPASGNIMSAHAQGYTPEQIQAIAAYLRQ